jgi:hypothetical protein
VTCDAKIRVMRNRKKPRGEIPCGASAFWGLAPRTAVPVPVRFRLLRQEGLGEVETSGIQNRLVYE